MFESCLHSLNSLCLATRNKVLTVTNYIKRTLVKDLRLQYLRLWRQKLKISHKQKKRVQVRTENIWNLTYRVIRTSYILDGWKYNITEMGINHKILIPKTLKMKLSLCRRPWSVVRLFPLTLNWTMSVNWNRPGSKNDFRWPRSGWAWSCYDFYLDWSLLCSRYHLVFKWSSTASYTTKEGYFLVFPPKSLF